MTQSTRPVFWAGIVGAPLLLITAYAHYLWYHILVARGYGYAYNAAKYTAPFWHARLFLLIALAAGATTFWFTRQSLPKIWRIGYKLVLALGIVLFVVHWIVVQFGPEPWWHHP